MLANHVEPGRSRIAALDFTKGVLVLLMVVYHVLNYLEYGSIPHDYLGFVPASFIMVTGFLVAQVYAVKAKVDFNGAAQRLVVRAVKLLLMFTVLNVGARLAWSRNRYGTELDLAAFFRDWASVYLKGDAAGVAFDVLVPISYTLLVSVLLLSAAASKRATVHTLALALFLTCAVLESRGNAVTTLNLVSAGVLGVSLGALPREAMQRFSMSAGMVWMLGAGYLGVLLLGMDNYPAQIFSTVAWLAILFWIGRVSSSNRWWFEQICLLGRYSLIGYIAQILYLQGTHTLLVMAPQSTFGKATVVTAVIGVATWATILALEEVRQKSRAVDRAYRAVFA